MHRREACDVGATGSEAMRRLSWRTFLLVLGVGCLACEAASPIVIDTVAAEGALIAHPEPVLRGRTKPGRKVRLQWADDDASQVEVGADETGNWAARIGPLAEGPHQVQVSGHSLFSREFPLRVQASPPEGVLVAHALGAIDGVVKSNSVEAYQRNLQQGKRWFEVDLSIAADGVAVCFHPSHQADIGENRPISNISSIEFIQKKFKDQYTLMTFSTLLRVAAQSDDVYLITDTKGWSAKNANIIADEIHQQGNIGHRVIPQIYKPADLELLLSLRDKWDFPYAIFTLYMSNMNDAQVVEYVSTQERIPIVVMPNARAKSVTFIQELRRSGKRIMVHTLNVHGQMMELFSRGVSGIYTDNYIPWGP